MTTQTIYLDPALVPASLRGGYSGKQFKARVCESVTIPSDAGLWSGGSRNTFRAVNFATGEQVRFPGQELAPWDNRQERVVTLQPGFAVVEHSLFCGKDMGLTFYVHPQNAMALLPPPATELTPVAKLVLIATRSLKSSYGGRDRYDNAQGEYDCKQALGDRPYPSREEWNIAKAQLIDRGYLNKAGAITNAGRNAIPSRY